MFKLVLLINIFTILKICDCARILGIGSTPSYSHQIAFQPLWKELSLRGHQMIVITTDPINDPSLTNLTEINVHDMAYKVWNNIIQGKLEKNDLNVYSSLALVFLGLHESSKAELDHPEVKSLIENKTESFDLVIVEFLNPIMYAFAERFKCPLIGITSFDPFGSVYRQIGGTSHPVLNPDVILPCEEKLTFTNRVTSVVYTLLATHIFESHFGLVNQAIQNKFGKNYPTVEEITKNMSMMFVNSDQIMYRIRSFPPNIIPIGGGIKFKSSKPLAQDLKAFLDKASQGFIYFSLGSNIKSKDLSKEKRNMLMKTFVELPYDILWKFEAENLEGLPSNVMIYKWLPQQDVLRHPNIKLFITQGGLQSLEEALHSHVPLIVLPFFGDQESNAKRAEVKGIGLSLDINSLEKDEFKKNILEVIENPKYKERVKELSDLILDEPMSGLERAVWWSEYVIRHKGAKHFKNPAIDLPLYQYYLLDVFGFFLFILLSPFIIYKLIRLMI